MNHFNYGFGINQLSQSQVKNGIVSLIFKVRKFKNTYFVKKISYNKHWECRALCNGDILLFGSVASERISVGRLEPSHF